MKRTASSRALLVALAILIGALTASCASNTSRQENALDQRILVNGHQMHLTTEGEGVPVVFTSGGGATNNTFGEFQSLYPGLRGHAKIVAYERAGYGQSEPTKLPRTIDVVAAEIHELLEKAGVAKPFVYVGHSMGALEMLRYAQLYPADVRGLVLIEGAPPSQYFTMGDFSPFDLALLWFQSEGKGIVGEAPFLKANAETILGAGPVSVPLTYLVAGSNGIPGWLDRARKDFKSTSSIKEVLIPEAYHFLHRTHPGPVTDEILKMLNQ